MFGVTARVCSRLLSAIVFMVVSAKPGGESLTSVAEPPRDKRAPYVVLEGK